jgi:SAM-dependent methyltransferase
MVDEKQRTGWYYRAHAWALARGSQAYEDAVAERKRRLFGDLQGTIVELGPGAGVNLPYFQTGITWIGVEPNPYNHDHIRAKASECGLAVQFRGLTGNRLDVPDSSADVVVCTLVLCTVPDPPATLREILRTLKPRGRFVFMEHVAAPEGSSRRRWQKRVKPLWAYLLDGCCPDRETGEAIARAGFDSVNIESFRAPLPLVSPHISGWARKGPA